MVDQAALKNTGPGERLAVYRTRADPGIAGVFDVAAKSFDGGQLNQAVYGCPTDLDQAIGLAQLRADPILEPIFRNLQRRRYLEGDAAHRLAEMIGVVPIVRSKDPLPEPGDPDWVWHPIESLWGAETFASDRLAATPSAWRRLDFAKPPDRERSPAHSRLRTDLHGDGHDGEGIIVEVKHFADRSTLGQLLDYLKEARRADAIGTGISSCSAATPRTCSTLPRTCRSRSGSATETATRPSLNSSE